MIWAKNITFGFITPSDPFPMSPCLPSLWMASWQPPLPEITQSSVNSRSISGSSRCVRSLLEFFLISYCRDIQILFIFNFFKSSLHPVPRNATFLANSTLWITFLAPKYNLCLAFFIDSTKKNVKRVCSCIHMKCIHTKAQQQFYNTNTVNINK